MYVCVHVSTVRTVRMTFDSNLWLILRNTGTVSVCLILQVNAPRFFSTLVTDTVSTPSDLRRLEFPATSLREFETSRYLCCLRDRPLSGVLQAGSTRYHVPEHRRLFRWKPASARKLEHSTKRRTVRSAGKTDSKLPAAPGVQCVEASATAAGLSQSM
jgi:hypothetical protein